MVVPVGPTLGELLLQNILREYTPGVPRFGFSMPTLEGLKRGMMGPVGRSLVDALEELEKVKAERDALAEQLEVRRTMKRRSPALWRFRVRRWELGEQTFYPQEYPEGKTGPNLRVYIHQDDPSEGAPYWDITSKRLIGMLFPILPHVAGTGAYVEIRKHGDGRTSHYSMSVHPA